MDAPKELRDLLRNAALNDWGPGGDVVQWRDKTGAISSERLNKVLEAIAVLGEGRVLTEKQISAKAEIPVRTVQRALAVLKINEVLVAEEGRNLTGHKKTSYSILRPMLRLLARDQRLPIFQKPRATRGGHAPQDASHAPPKPRATHGGEGGDFLDSFQEQENSPPSPPLSASGGAWQSPVAHGPSTVARGDNEWYAAERALRGAGLFKARSIVEAARREARIAPEEIVALAQFFAAHRGAWGSPGVIGLVISEWTPGERPDNWNVWPPANTNYRREQHVIAEQHQRQTQAAALAETVEVESHDSAEMEAEFGPELDAIFSGGGRRLDELLDQTPQLKHSFWRERLRNQGPTQPTVRLFLLQTLARNSEGETDGIYHDAHQRPAHDSVQRS